MVTLWWRVDHDADRPLERLCLGPRELDLTCNDTAARSRCRMPEDDAFLAGYGGHDAASQPAYLDLARTRLAWALAGLRG